jgi:RNA polymerase sigma-70 factor, ECF subfamily
MFRLLEPPNLPSTSAPWMVTMPSMNRAALPSDAELVARLVWQDEAALSELYDRYSGALFGLALRVSGSRERAEEIVQDTFLKLWRDPKRFDPSRAALSTFLLTLVRNASIDSLRRERSTSPLEDEDGQPLPLASDHATPLEQAELAQDAQHIRMAMAQLSAAHRQTVELAYFQGASREEIAAAMNVPVGTVKSRLKYALDKLRNAVGEP